MTSAQLLIQARRVAVSGVGKAIRQQAGLSLSQFGAEMDPPVPGSTIWRWEEGVAKPQSDRATAYLAAIKRIQEAPGPLDAIGA